MGNKIKKTPAEKTGAGESNRRSEKNISDIHTLPLPLQLEKLMAVIEKDKEEINILKKQSESNRGKYANLFYHAPASCFLLDPHGIIYEANAIGASLLGKEPTQLLNQHFIQFVSEDSSGKFRKFCKKAFQFTGKVSCEIKLSLPGKQPLYVRLEGIAFADTQQCLAIMIDISNQKLTEDLLNRNEVRLETLIDLAVDAILLGNPEGIILQANKRMVELSGYSQNELIGKNIDLLFSNEERQRVPLKYTMLTEGKVVRSERYLQRKDMTLVPVEMNTKMMPDRSYQTFIRDMTDRKKIEDALQASEHKFSEAFRTSPDSININRLSDGVYIEINNGFTAITGYKPEEVMGRSSMKDGISLWVNQDDRDRMVEGLKSKGEVVGLEADFRMKDGTIRHGLLSARLLMINGENCILSTTRDITERKNAEEALIESEESYFGLINSVTESIYILNGEGVFIDVNDGAEKMYSYSREEIIGNTPEFLSAPNKNNMPVISKTLEKVFSTGESQQFEFWGKRKDGEVFPKEVICNKGNYFGKEVIIATARDITERKRTEEALIAAKEKAEESERLKSSFLANMSHEIRSPMNSILGFSELLDGEDLSLNQRHEFATIIKNSGKHLLTIINDIIDFAKIDSNQLTISRNSFNLNHLLDDVCLTLEIEKKRLDKNYIEVFLHKDIPNEHSTILCDEVRLKQVLINLTGNALKFTTEGHIRIGYRIDNDKLLFYVKDTGKGIAPEKHEIIFERFRQEEESYTRIYGGTGLGLSISKALVELLGGHMWLTSEVGKGSTFFFNLPVSILVNKPEQADIPVLGIQNYDFSGKTILVAEDIYSNYKLIRHMLTRANARVLYAEDGSQALKLCISDPTIDMILMDIQMPVMDGYEATREIRKIRPDLPVIALTAYTYAEDNARCMDAGCNDFLSKPIEKLRMLELVSKFITQQ